MRRQSVVVRFAVWFAALSILAAPAPIAIAQDAGSPELLKKELENSLAQLKAAQDRKNELANENEKLKQQLAALQREVDEMRRTQAAWAEQTFTLRAERAAWNALLERSPQLKAQWIMFLELGPVDPMNELPMTERKSPATQPSTTQPSSAPTTQPATTQGSPKSQ